MLIDKKSNELTTQDWQRLTSKLRQFFGKRVPNVVEVDDLVQIVLSKVHQHYATLRNKTAFNGWVFRIAHHVLTDYYRAKTTTVAFDEHIHSESDVAEENSVAECLLCMSVSLPADEQHLLQQIDIEQTSQKQLAAALNIPYSSLKSRVQRTRLKLKQQLLSCCAVEYDNAGRPIALLDATC